jgi:S-DNA-T family DNA segregation ATPase FtsK/SpoIIIE
MAQNSLNSKGKSGRRSRSKKEKKERKARKSPEWISKIITFVKDPRTRKTLGALMVLASFYLLLALTSYFFTWKADQSLVDGKSVFDAVFSSSQITVENWLGKLGASLSHQLMYNWFGISSFGLILLLFVFGLWISAGIKLLPLKKTTVITLVSVVWLSIFFGLFSGNDGFLAGGAFGYFTNAWLAASLGKIGAGMLILCSLFIVIVILFNPDFTAWFSKKDEAEVAEEDDEQLAVSDIHIVNPIKENQIVEEQISETISFGDEGEGSSEENSEEDEDFEISIGEEPEEETASDSENDEFEVEVPKSEEEMTEDLINEKLEEFGEFDPTLELSSYTLPSTDLLAVHGDNTIKINKQELEDNKNNIVQTLANYKIEIDKIKATVGPTVTLYEIVPAAGVRISKIKNLEDDIALSLAALGIRIIAPIPGRGTIGIEVPNSNPDIVSMRSLIASEKFQNSDFELPVALGKTISNETFIYDLAKMPHLLMAGATGQGKSVGLNAILVSILYKKHPSQVKFVLVDPKKVELTLFNKIERHFLAKLPGEEEAIITDTAKVVNTVNSLCIEMDERYDLLKEAQCRNIKEYNKKFINRRLNPENGHRFLPYIVLVIDEFADLIMTAGKEIETPIARLAQLARAIGIHLIVATQRPSVNIITGTIKANFPARIAFRVTSKIDSRTILDAGGADQLIGRGDMLFSTGNDLIRIQCGFVDTPEVDDICDFIGGQKAYPDALHLPEYIPEGGDSALDIDEEDRDALFEEAAKIVVLHQQGSASLLQRKLKLGYNRAGRIIDQLEAAGIVGPFKGSKAREVLYPDEISLEQFLNPGSSNIEKVDE